MATAPFGLGPEDLAVLWPAATFLLAFVAVVAAGSWLLVPALGRVVRARNPRNPTLNQAVEQYARAGVVLAGLAAGTVAAGYGYVLTGSALVVAAVTLALGVAGQEVIGNVISGVFLVGDPDFNVGDWIEWDGHAGVVVGIGFRATRVRTANNETVTVPNTALTTNPVTNPYGRSRYRDAETVAVAYGSDLDAVRETLAAAAREVPAVLDDPTPMVSVAALESDAIIFRLHYWVRDPDRREVRDTRTAVAQRAVTRLEDAGVTVAPPSQHELSGHLDVAREGDGEGE